MLTQILRGKCSALRAAVKSELKIKKITFEARELPEANANAITFLRKYLFNVERKCNKLTARTNVLLRLRKNSNLTAGKRT